ncbi:predicted protein [Sclerotinia sclerotiorum 1980 UF-70]|uniref:Peptidase M4 domain-containing protein n=2 Tax=Sclerotinia sclerotiorum (strain ATCC 18683 / 1980 / Ss-1) TaxID=665079 RepID=A0A1D9QB49_SCLS1|nr:predicted protein [Sclerotinia sclerotiorum 1980 UF-70]APA12141.1 hypothetical protein sscle_09g069110 [Sclerotinia sclerotiorum 1980 UF-70]EDN95014.1 predicted protein [Sclerotinia sclerotiorum 1980 UF-70]
MARFCSIVPPHVLKHIIDSPLTRPATLLAAQKTYDHVCRIHECRVLGAYMHDDAPDNLVAGIIPLHISQSVFDSEEASAEEKEHAKHNLAYIDQYHATRADRSAEERSTTRNVHRKVYSSEGTNEIRKRKIYDDRYLIPLRTMDWDAQNVYQYFRERYEFYDKVFNHNSIDDKGLHIVGNIHYDDQPGPPGFNNAFWNGREINFGDGDGDLFTNFADKI